MKKSRKLAYAIAGVALASLVWWIAGGALVAVTLEPAEHGLLAEQMAPRWAWIALIVALGWVAMAFTLRWFFRGHTAELARLVEQTQMLLVAEHATPRHHGTPPEAQALEDAIFALATQRDSFRADVARKIEQANLSVQQEKNRLAALMAELTQSVVVCNLEGRILLYNNRARLQFKALSKVPAVAGGAELVGIGRSIYTVFDRQLVAHALERIAQRLSHGATSPSAQFVISTPTGQWLRVQVAPVHHVVQAGSGSDLNGFVLMLDNVTRAFEEAHARDEQLHRWTEGSRSSLAVVGAALNQWTDADATTPVREKALAVVREELARMAERTVVMSQQAQRGTTSRWPLEDVMGTDVLVAAQRRMESRNQRPVTLENVDPTIWLRVDSFSLTQALDYLAARLVDEFDIRFFRLRLQAVADRAQLDLIWTGQAMSTETVMGWETDAMSFGAESTPLTVRDVVERHSGSLSFARERVRHEAFFRFDLPMLSVQEQAAAIELQPGDSRPEFYDFDLFQTTEQTCAMNDRLLSDLTYTAFDTETTGLHPSGGDEIVQIGAARCVNGKLLRHESFEQLVNPGRLIPPATIAIHGITQDMVRGQPAITEVLPAFYSFAHETVLVAHNAAFDMKFLQLQERNTGLVFDHPVLDTLLLSAVVHPHQESHRLEAIAERFHIPVVGRHTALADALLTAEVWLRLIPLLQAMGIHTLGQAREAAQKTYYARLKY